MWGGVAVKKSVKFFWRVFITSRWKEVLCAGIRPITTQCKLGVFFVALFLVERESFAVHSILPLKEVAAPSCAIPLRPAVEEMRPLEIPFRFQRGAGSPVHRAAWLGNVFLMETLIALGEDPNAVDANGLTPFHIAVQERNEKMVRYLINRGDVNLHAKNHAGVTALHLASVAGRETILKLILWENAENLTSEDFLSPQLAIREGLFVDEPSDFGPPIHWAAQNGSPLGLSMLLSAGANPDARNLRDQTALLLAVNSRIERSAEVQILLDAGASPNARDITGRASAHWAVHWGHIGTLRLLLQAKGADPNIRNNEGEAPLHMAAQTGNGRVALQLLREGAKPNARTNSGWLSLHIAVMNNNLVVMRILLENGAYLNAQGGKFHETPWALATTPNAQAILAEFGTPH